jgi:CheY-like chemotaxis protein
MGTFTVQDLNDLGLVAVARAFDLVDTAGAVICPTPGCREAGRTWSRDPATGAWHCGACHLGVRNEVASFLLARMVVGSGARIDRVLEECERRGLRPLSGLAIGSSDVNQAAPPVVAVVGSGEQVAKRSVLLVEDDSDLADALRQALEDEGFQVVHLLGGAQARSRLPITPRPELAIVDLALPDMDGADLIAALHDDAQLRSIPIVVMSGTRLPEVPSWADALLYKPFPLDDLLALIRKALAGRDLPGPQPPRST